MIKGKYPLFHKHEIHSRHQTDKCSQVIPMQRLAFEDESGKDSKDNQRNNFLNNFKLHQAERAAVSVKADTVGRHLTGVFRQGNQPGKQNDAI